MKLTYGVLIALIFASVAPGCGPSNGSDSGTPDTDAGMMSMDGGHDVDAALPPDVDAGTEDRPDSGGDGMICRPATDTMCTMGSYTGCRCDPAPYARACEVYWTACSRPGVNTCDVGRNHCGYDLPMDMPSYAPFTHTACMTNLFGLWSVMGEMTEYTITHGEGYNGQLSLNINPGPHRIGPFFTGVTLSGDRGWYNWTNMNDPDMGLHCWFIWDPTCTGGEIQCWEPGVDPRVTPDARMAPGFPRFTNRLRSL